MAKFNPSKLSKKEKQELFMQLCYVLSQTKNIKEAAELLRDLLTEQEVEMLSKRLQVADLLIDNHTYTDIQRILKVSNTTIARVHEWLRVAGEGFRSAKAKLEKYKERKDKGNSRSNNASWGAMKRKYPLYFWPQLLLEEITKSANQKQKRNISMVLRQTKEKTRLYRQLNKILKS